MEVFPAFFTRIHAEDIRKAVDEGYDKGKCWPDPLIQLNSNYKRTATIPELCKDGLLHPACERFFMVGKPEGRASAMTLFSHQLEAIAIAQRKEGYVVTTGTGSGKFGEVLEKTKQKLDAASKEIDSAGVRSRAIERQLRDVQGLPAGASAKLLEKTTVAD